MHFDLFLKKEINEAHLWLYKKEGVTEFSITHEISIDGTEEKERITTIVSNQTSSKSWIRFDVSRLVAVEGVTTVEFEVTPQNPESCIEIEGDQKPFLLLHTVPNLKSISKRSSYCANDSSTCCRKKYVIKFKDINHWSEWIIEPEGYEANYCAGTCNNNDLSFSYHASVFMALCENNPQKFRETGKKECLTCAPTEYKPLSVIYLDENKVQVVSRLPGMSVTQCGCI